MITLVNIKKEQRKMARRELIKIESKLHPVPTINGFEILHEHKGQFVYFSAWKNGWERRDKYVKVNRQEILMRNIMDLKNEYLEFLTE